MAGTVSDPGVDTIRRVVDLSELADALGVDSVHEAYFEAKAIWREAIGASQETGAVEGLPGSRVAGDGGTFYVHGITHAGTEAEGNVLREHVGEFLDSGATIHCEQGIRPMYFEEFPAVCGMDDYLWATRECERLDADAGAGKLSETGVDAVMEGVASVAGTFREATFSLIESGTSVYGEEFGRALGDVAAAFLTDHADIGRATSYEAFRLSRVASQQPARLVDLQRYYERSFLPQPLEREWIRRHDPELELMSHARNERMAEYAISHNRTAGTVHLIVGAAHQPGVCYYLEAFMEDPDRSASFDPL